MKSPSNLSSKCSHASSAHVPSRVLTSRAPCVSDPRQTTARLQHNATSQSTTQPSTGGARGQSRRSKTKEQLLNPAQIGASSRRSVKVKESQEATLSDYMYLPVEQYFVLDPKRIRHIEGSRFLISIPRIEVLGTWLEPDVEISVVMASNPVRVVLEASDYSLRGSEGIEMMRLNERFAMKFVTELTWSSAAALSSGSQPSSSSSSRMVGPPHGEISASAKLDVWAEVIPPFNMMPREVLQASCNIVINGLLNTMLPLFVNLLGEDYQKWSQDGVYRKQRALRSKPLEVLN